MTQPKQEEHRLQHSTVIKLSKRLAIEDFNDREATIFHTETGKRMQLSRALYDFILSFSEPTRISDIVPEESWDKVKPTLEQLVAKGFLLQPGVKELEKRIRISPYTLFQAPRYRSGEKPAAVSVVGVPLEIGNRGEPGMRDAPSAIRLRSLDFEYRIDMISRQPVGWFDVQREHRILEGVTISDWGDLCFEYGESPRRIFERLGSICSDILDAGSMPLLIGGDQSICLPVIDCLQQRQELVVVYFDAHTDFAPVREHGGINHANVCRRVSMLEGVAKTVQVGHRGFTASDKIRNVPARVSRVSTSRCRTGGIEAIMAELPEDLPCYLSIDINCLDPIYAPGTSLPAPGGFSVDELKDILWAIGTRRKVVGLDLSEVNPARDAGWLTSITACHLLLTALGAATSGADSEQA